jgi:hypothetical protein
MGRFARRDAEAATGTPSLVALDTKSLPMTVFIASSSESP